MRKQTLILLALVSYLSLATFVSAQTEEEKIAQLREQITQLEQQATQFRGTIAQQQEQANTLKNQIANLKTQISAIQNQIALTGKKIDKTSIEINDTQNDIYDTQEKIDYQKESIGRILLYLNKVDSETLLGILIKNKNITDFLRQAQYASMMNQSLLGLISQYKGTKLQYESQKSDLENKKGSLIGLKNDQSSQKLALDQATKAKNQLLADTKGQEAIYQKMLAEVERKQSLFFTELKELETRIIQGGLYILHVKAENLPKKGTDLFRWPEDGFVTTQTYGCTTFARCGSSRGPYGGAIHNGIDLKVGYGTPIKAIGDGEIIANGKNDGWGNWLAIKHPPHNLVSVYAHMSAFEFLRVGTQVKAGETLGYEGSTGFSTGSHVHLSIYKEFFTYVKEKNGQLYFNYDNTIDPRDYLP